MESAKNIRDAARGGIQRKLVIAFLLLGIGPMAIMGVISYYNTSRALLHQTYEQRARGVDFLPQPEAHVERDLLVPAAPGVDLVGERAYALLQLPDHERVDVLVARPFAKAALLCLFADLFEGVHERGAFFGEGRA